MIASEGQTEPIYRLKHRLTGAVVLVLVAVFAIPMLLKDPVGHIGSAHYTEGERSTFRSRIEPYEEMDNSIEGQSNPLPTTIISSDEMTTITIGASTTSSDAPSQRGDAASDRSNVEQQPKAAIVDLANDLTDTQEDQPTRPALVPTSQPKETAPKAAQKNTASQIQQTTATTASSQPSIANTTEKKTEPVVLTKKPKQNIDSSTSQTATAEVKRTPKVAENATSTKPKKTISDESATPEEGVWVVRVGTFSKASNVASVSGLLTKNGLKARTTQVQTSFGAATRIWLGPYADKNSAITISAQLKALTGEKGYITRHTP